MARLKDKMDRQNKIYILLTLIVIFLVGLTLKLAQPFIIIILIAVLLAYIMDPLVAFLKNLKIPLLISALITALIFLSVFFVFGIIIYRSMLDFAGKFPSYQLKLMSMITDILSKIHFEADEIIKKNFLDELKKIPIGSIVLSAAGSIMNFIKDFFVVFLYSLFILLGKYSLTRKLLRSFPRERGKRIAIILKHIDSGLRNYIGIKTLMSVSVGIGTGLILIFFKVEFAIILGFLTFILNFIPYLGSTIAVMLPPLIAIVQFGTFSRALWVLLALVVLQNLIGQVIEPRTVGHRLNLSITVVFFALLFWGWLWGAPGVLLAIPMTTSIKIVMENIPSYRPLALMLGRTGKRGRKNN